MAKKPKDPNELTEIEKKFVDCYFNYNFNGRLAYKACYPNVTSESADVLAHRMLSKVKVMDAIELKHAYIRMKENVDLGWLVGVLKGVVFDVQQEGIERDDTGRITAKPDRKALLGAIQQLAKLGGLETKKLDITTNGESINTITWNETKSYEEDIPKEENDTE